MFVGRLPDGTIYGLWTSPQPADADHPGMEELPDDHPDVIAFLNRPSTTQGKTLEERVSALETDVATIAATALSSKVTP